MADKDALTKDYMQDPERFADAFNYLLYDGKQVIKPENLKPQDSASLAVLYGEDGKVVPIQKFRDVLKLASIMEDSDAVYLFLGIENQSEIHYAMPVRNMVYDSMAYNKQVDEKAKKNRDAGKASKSGGEFLSGFLKTDKLLPVITLVVYFGADEWIGPRDLHSMLDANEHILRFVPNYPIHLITPADFQDENFPKLVSELRLVLEYLKYSKDENKLHKLVNEDAAFKSVSKKTVDVVNVLTNSSIVYNKGEERVNMCEAIEKLISKGEARGREEGRVEGRLETLKENAANMRAEGLDDEMIARILRVSVADVKIWLDSDEN